MGIPFPIPTVRTKSLILAVWLTIKNGIAVAVLLALAGLLRKKHRGGLYGKTKERRTS